MRADETTCIPAGAAVHGSQGRRTPTRYARLISKYVRQMPRLRVLWKVPGPRRRPALRPLCGISTGQPQSHRASRRVRRRQLHRALERPAAGRARWYDNSHRRPRSHSDRRAGALERLDGTTQVQRLVPAAPSFVVAAEPSSAAVAYTYLKLGVEHILGGIDHLLFVLALLLLVQAHAPARRDGHRFHGRAQHYAGGCLARITWRAGSTGRGMHRAEHRIRSRGDRARRNGQPRLTAHGPGSWRSPSAYCTGSASRGPARVGLPQLDIPLALFFVQRGRRGRTIVSSSPWSLAVIAFAAGFRCDFRRGRGVSALRYRRRSVVLADRAAGRSGRLNTPAHYCVVVPALHCIEMLAQLVGPAPEDSIGRGYVGDAARPLGEGLSSACASITLAMMLFEAESINSSTGSSGPRTVRPSSAMSALMMSGALTSTFSNAGRRTRTSGAAVSTTG